MPKLTNDGRDESTAVAIDKDKGSQYALKWAVDHLLTKGQTLTLLHVKQKPSTIPTPAGNHVNISDVNDDVARAYREQLESQAKELFLPFRVFCTRKDIHCNEVILEEADVAKGVIEYITNSAIEVLVLGSPSRSGFMRRFKTTDIPSSVSKGAPDFCTVYVINKGKISSVRSSTRPAPAKPRNPNPPIQTQSSNFSDRPSNFSDRSSNFSDRSESSYRNSMNPRASTERTPTSTRYNMPDDSDFRSPFTRPSANKTYEQSLADSDISYVSSGRPSIDRLFDSQLDAPRMSNSSEYEGRSSFGSGFSGNKSLDITNAPLEFSNSSWSSQSSQNIDDVEAEMRRLKLELKQTMDMYSTACKEALTAKQKARELQRWKLEEEQRLEEARIAEESAVALAEKERAKCRNAVEAAEAAQRIADLESQKRRSAEMKAIMENEDESTSVSFGGGNLRYRRYSIEEIETATEYFSEGRKIGEGGYGPVYRGKLDHTPVAIKVLRPDAAQGRSQFNQEVEVLSCIRHPNMVLLLGACPEYGCLVYEYMANGSLEDRLLRRGNTPVLPWQVRFRIAAEIGTGLLFLHQTKPEPLVHRDLKPGNILLDRNYVSKISDVGLARLVPPSVANSVTQYRMTSTAGTFCYIDPEYQQTGMLGIKSDIYSLGIMLLQIITAKPPMGLTHHVERSIEKGNFEEMLDPEVHDWPVQEALTFAKLSLQCAELRRKDRPDLGNEVLPELNRLRELGEDNMPNLMFMGASPFYSGSSIAQSIMSDSHLSGYSSSRSRASTS